MKPLSRVPVRAWLTDLTAVILLVAFALPLASALIPEDDCCSEEVDCCDFDSCHCACHAATGLLFDIRISFEFKSSVPFEPTVSLFPAEVPRSIALPPPRFSA